MTDPLIKTRLDSRPKPGSPIAIGELAPCPPLHYSINLTLDGCVNHRAGSADEELHHHATETIARADALLFGRVTYEMMAAAFRVPAQTGVRADWMEPWMEPFAQRIDAAKKYVLSNTHDRIDWNAELLYEGPWRVVQRLQGRSRANIGCHI